MKKQIRSEEPHVLKDNANLYYCCELCQSTKKESWDEQLLRPDDDAYSFSNFFIYDYTTGQISPNPKASVEDQNRTAVTIYLYGLDTQSRRLRRKLVLKQCEDAKQPTEDDCAYRDYISLSRANEVAYASNLLNGPIMGREYLHLLCENIETGIMIAENRNHASAE